jgi:hypothetical protein
MSSIEGGIAALSKALESQILMAEILTEAARVMDPNAVSGASSPSADIQSAVSQAVNTNLGSIIDAWV